MQEPAAKELYPGTFSRHAAAYKRRLDEVMARGEARGRTAVIDWLDLMPGKRVLDLACGPGTLSYGLARAVSPDGDVVGIDLAPGMIELAQRNAPAGLPFGVDVIEADYTGDRNFQPSVSPTVTVTSTMAPFGAPLRQAGPN